MFKLFLFLTAVLVLSNFLSLEVKAQTVRNETYRLLRYELWMMSGVSAFPPAKGVLPKEKSETDSLQLIEEIKIPLKNMTK